MLLEYAFGWMIIVSLGYLLWLALPGGLKLSAKLPFISALGLGTISILMMLLGFLYSFSLTSIALSLSLIFLVLILSNREKIKPKLEFDNIDIKLIVIILVFFMASLSHILLFPELFKDSSIYSLWTKIMYERGRIEFIEGGPSVGMGLASNYPSAYQAITVFFYMLTGESLLYARLTSLVISILLVLFVYDWAVDFFGNKNSAMYSILILLSLPAVIFFSRSASQYIYLTLQFSLACFLLKSYLDNGNTVYLYMSSLFGGFAALTTYIGGIFAVILTFVLLSRNDKPARILVAILIFAITISPWYMRNLLVLGNPLWPMGGGRYIDPNIENHAFSQLNGISKLSGFNYDSLGDVKNSTVRLLFSYLDYSDASIYHSLNPFFTLFSIPAIILWVKNKDRKLDFFAIWFLIFLCFYVAIFNYWNRYLMLIAVPTAFLSLDLIQKFKHEKLRRFIHHGIVLMFAFSIFLSIMWDDCPQPHGFDDITRNLGNHSELLKVCYGDDISIAEWINENLPENAFIATTDYKLYYYERPVIEMNSWRLKDLYYSRSIEESVDVLKANGITHMVVTGKIEEVDFYPDYFRIVKEINGKFVYEIS